MPIALQELPFFADSFEILNDSILIFNGAAFEDQVVLWDYRNKKRINSYLKYTPHYNCRPLKPFTKCNNEILWQREFEQMLYRVTEQELIPARYIDFQEFAYNGKLEKTPQGIYFLQPDIAHMNRYYENDKYIHFIFECEALNPFVHSQQGQTDSERILCYLISRIDELQKQKGKGLSQEERVQLVEEVVRDITPENKVNFLLYDGELLYVHTNYRNSLYRCRRGRAVIISTRPLDGNVWENIPLNTLLVYKKGSLLYTGTNHEHEFMDSEEKMRLLFLDYANL